MKICYLKYGCFCSLIPYVAKSPYSYVGGNDERMSILKFFHEMGWDVIINSIVYKKDYDWIHSDDCKGSKWAWLRDFDYKLFKSVPKGYKVFVEFGTTNIRYAYGKERRICLYDFNEVIKNYKGNIYFWHGDGALPIVFHPQKLNYNWVKTQIDEEWARNVDTVYKHSYKTMTKNKYWVIIQRGHLDLKDIFLKKNDMPRGQYPRLVSEGHASIECIPTGLHFDLVYNGFHKPKKEIKYPYIYIGNARARVRRFREYYDSTGAHVFGNWSDNFKKTCNGINFHGKIPQGDAIKYYRRACCTTLIGDDFYERLGWWTPRIMETVAGGCILLVHKEYNNYQELNFPEVCCVKNKKDMLHAIKYFYKMKYKRRLNIVDAQQKAIRQWSIYRWGRTLKNIINKYERLKLWRKK